MGMTTWDDLQHLTPSQGALLYRLVDLGYLTKARVDEIIQRLVSERFAKAAHYLAFAQQIDANLELNQPHIISRCYYAMYHAARALALHFRRSDVDDHERLPVVLGQTLGMSYKETLGRWREVRNQIDYSPYAPEGLEELVKAALDDADKILAACREALIERGVNL